MTIPIILSIVCACSAVFFIRSEYTWEKKRTILLKSISSILFVAVGVCGYIVMGTSNSYALWMIAALTMGLLGDVLLALPDTDRNFICGLSAFLVGHVIYAVVLAIHNGFAIYDVLIFAGLIMLSVSLYRIFGLKAGNMKIPAGIYVMIISFMYTIGLSIFTKMDLITLQLFLVVAGASFFVASDMLFSLW